MNAELRRMAEEAGLAREVISRGEETVVWFDCHSPSELEAFAKLVAEDATMIAHRAAYNQTSPRNYADVLIEVRDAIRARYSLD